MFFKQVWRNAARNRKGNGLFFASLIIAIIAFYTLLSLEAQDVMRFLASIESDAVGKLLLLIPAVYLVSLFFVFFLVYFACRYQIDSRRREFGMYLMLGMKRSRLFAMLFGETLCSSLIALLFGLPAALFLTEGISLATARLVGLGIIGHKISFSATALLWTVCGFVAVQLLSMLILCMKLAATEPAEFLRSDSAQKQAGISLRRGSVHFAAGVVLLAAAYTIGLVLLRTFNELAVLALLVVGTAGTFFLYRGLGCFIGKRIQKKSMEKAGLAVFTGRQIHENVLCQHKTLAVASLLLLLALACISFGIGVSTGRMDYRTTDFSVECSKTEIDGFLQEPAVSAMVETSYPVYLSRIDAPCKLDALQEALGRLPASGLRDNMMQYITESCEYSISESSFNRLLEAIGKEPLKLDGEMAVFSSIDDANIYDMLDKALKQEVRIQVNGTEYRLLPELYHDNIVADRMISLYAALIVPDEVFAEIAADAEPYCYNLHLAKMLTEEKGLMQAIQEMQTKLDAYGMEYDSYLGGIGRNLFYTVAASYLTIYLGVLFLLISNTVMGLKYLIQQRQNKHRYITLMMLGADTEALCRSVRSQIWIFFGLVLGVAIISSIFAVFSMFNSFTKLPDSASVKTAILIAGAAFVLFVLIEAAYMRAVERAACREIRGLKVTDRRRVC